MRTKNAGELHKKISKRSELHKKISKRSELPEEIELTKELYEEIEEDMEKYQRTGELPLRIIPAVDLTDLLELASDVMPSIIDTYELYKAVDEKEGIRYLLIVTQEMMKTKKGRINK